MKRKKKMVHPRNEFLLLAPGINLSIIMKIKTNEKKKEEWILITFNSQGGAIALYAGLTFERKLAGIIALSTYLPLSTTFPQVINITCLIIIKIDSFQKAISSANQNTPILMCHGERDEIVKFEWGKMSYDLIKRGHQSIFNECLKLINYLLSFISLTLKDIQLKTYKDMGHSSCGEEIMDILGFLGSVMRK